MGAKGRMSHPYSPFKLFVSIHSMVCLLIAPVFYFSLAGQNSSFLGLVFISLFLALVVGLFITLPLYLLARVFYRASASESLQDKLMALPFVVLGGCFAVYLAMPSTRTVPQNSSQIVKGNIIEVNQPIAEQGKRSLQSIDSIPKNQRPECTADLGSEQRKCLSALNLVLKVIGDGNSDPMSKSAYASHLRRDLPHSGDNEGCNWLGIALETMSEPFEKGTAPTLDEYERAGKYINWARELLPNKCLTLDDIAEYKE